MRMALLGGTFNPIHMGHLFIAEVVLVSLGYDRIVFVPSFRPAHKDVLPGDDPELRLEMARIATAGRREFIVEDCEIRRRGTSYTMDTIEHLAARYPVEGKIGLIIGDDLVPGFHTWKMVDKLREACRVLITRRQWEQELPFSGDHAYIDNTVLRISSSDIRRRVSKNEAFRYLVPETVYDFIRTNGLYRTGD